MVVNESEGDTSQGVKESGGILPIRLSNHISKKQLDDFAGKTQAKSRNHLVNVLLRFGVQRLSTTLDHVDILHKLLAEVIAENPVLFKEIMDRVGISKEKLVEIDSTMEFLKKLQIYLSPMNPKAPQILEGY